MSWASKLFTSSLGRKLVMSLTGIFLIFFLLEHFIGNVLLVTSFEEGGDAFNLYAHFMKSTLIIKIAEVGLFGGFLFHIVEGIILIRKNRAARPQRYAVASKSRTTSSASKYMGALGIIILVFFIIHLNNFFRYKYLPTDSTPEHVVIDGVEMEDMAALAYHDFASLGMVIFYVLAMAVIAFHLWHGFQSAFQTLGLNHKKYTPLIQALGKGYAILIPLGMALIPVLIYIMNLQA
ncbi:MAG: succinate dehydrogenase cytochrome b subunit [Bacteroidota bacterium]